MSEDAGPIPKSYKRHVIEAIFNDRWDASTRTLSSNRVTLLEVQHYIRAHNKRTGARNSDKNPANFFKDFIRVRRSANLNWPQTVFERGYSGRQLTGNEFSFEFVPVIPGQSEPFPGSALALVPEDAEVHIIESLSLPIASRRLGRRDETWLTQVLVRLRIIETHFAIRSSRPLLHIDHLQMTVKLYGAEVDSMYLGVERIESGALVEHVIACEAKGIRDDILVSQIVNQAQRIFTAPNIAQNSIIPVAVKVIGRSRLLVVEFHPVTRDNMAALSDLQIADQAIYELKPHVEGVY